MGGMTDFHDLGVAFTRLTDVIDSAVTDVGSGRWVALSGVAGFPDYNMAGFTADASTADVDVVLARLEELDLDAILMVESGGGALTDHLSAAGLTAAGEAPIMRCSTDGLDDLPGPPDGVEMRIGDGSDMAVAASLIAEAFSFDEASTQLVSPPALAESVDVWLVENDGKPVASGTFVRDGSSVSVFAMATPPSERRKGYGAAVLSQAIRHYAADGVESVILGATEAGFPLYAALGFETTTTATVFVRGSSAQFH